MNFFEKNKHTKSDTTQSLVEAIDKRLEGVIESTDALIEPVRRSAFRRFPTLFLLLVTFGVSAVVYSFERLLMDWTYLYDRPWLILVLGVAVLALTGKLYKKLDQ